MISTHIIINENKFLFCKRLSLLEPSPPRAPLFLLRMRSSYVHIVAAVISRITHDIPALAVFAGSVVVCKPIYALLMHTREVNATAYTVEKMLLS
jgi:hypothetical protein